MIDQQRDQGVITRFEQGIFVGRRFKINQKGFSIALGICSRLCMPFCQHLIRMEETGPGFVIRQSSKTPSYASATFFSGHRQPKDWIK